MSGVKQLTTKVAEIARRTAKQLSPITEGVVLSRNPDGTLNVDDGQGGCIRQAPKANVRVGQKVKLGLEPSLGQQTDLSQETITIDPSTKDCPGDGRYGEDVSFPRTGNVFSMGWVDPAPGQSYPGRDGIWANRLHTGGASLLGPPAAGLLYTDTNREALLSATRRSGSYSSTTIDPYANQLTLGASRLHLTFDTRDISLATPINTARMRVAVRGNTIARIRNDRFARLVVAPAFHADSPTTADWGKITPNRALATVAISTVYHAQQPEADVQYYFDFVLKAPKKHTLAEFITREGLTKLVLMLESDYNVGSSTPTRPDAFTSPGTPNEIRDVDDFVLTNNDAGFVLLVNLTPAENEGHGVTTGGHRGHALS